MGQDLAWGVTQWSGRVGGPWTQGVPLTEERETDLEETERREMSLQENAPEEVDIIGEVETGLKKTEREISPNEEIPEMPDAAEEVETDLEETDRREISTQ